MSKRASCDTFVHYSLGLTIQKTWPVFCYIFKPIRLQAEVIKVDTVSAALHPMSYNQLNLDPDHQLKHAVLFLAGLRFTFHETPSLLLRGPRLRSEITGPPPRPPPPRRRRVALSDTMSEINRHAFVMYAARALPVADMFVS